MEKHFTPQKVVFRKPQSILPNPRSIFESFNGKISDTDWWKIEDAFLEYGKQIRDKTLEWASTNANMIDHWDDRWVGDSIHVHNPDGPDSYYVIDNESILKGSESDDLKI